jgi:DNA-binding NtrC family response regulator
VTAPIPARILVVDDEPAVVDLVRRILQREGYEVEGVTAPADALARVREVPFELVISDVEMPGMRGTRLLQELLAVRPNLLVVLITAFGSIDLAVETLRAGAADFLSKPFAPETLRHVVGRTLRERALRREVVRLRRELGRQEASAGLVAESPSMKRVLEQAARLAPTRGHVLITGESGTGKSELARWIHARSPRADRALVEVNSSTLPEPLAEAELFGVRRGAFTDAKEDRPGLFLRADRGTLLLDEVGELPRPVQAKLLQVLETGRVRRVGGVDDEAVDVRLIAATNVDLRKAIDAGAFRADLYFRLEVFRLELPSLRDRPEDVPALVDLWLQRLADRHERPVVGLTAQAWRWMATHPWPGNVRELVHRLERALVLSEHDVIGVEDLALPSGTDAAASDGLVDLGRLVRAGLTMDDVERLYARAVLEHVGGNKADAARRLGLDRKTLYKRLEEPADDDR